MAVVESPVQTRATAEWITRPLGDVVMAFAWVPVFLAALHWRNDPSALASLTATVLLVSFCHQPVTLPLIYGDVRERAHHLPLLVLAPVVAVAVTYAGLTISLVLIAVVSGLWNAHHTLRQRYGLVRIYGRKVGQDDGTHEQAMLLWWFAAALSIAVAGDALVDRIAALPLGVVNQGIVDLLESFRPAAVVVSVGACIGAAITTWRWVVLECGRRRRNLAKYVYLGGAGALFVLAPFDPIAVFLGFMSAHSIEYFVVVERTLPRRAVPGSVLGRVSARRFGPALFLVGYVAAVLAVVAVLRQMLPPTLFLAVYLSFGVLHFVYDGMIWRLRKPAVAGQFGIEST